MKSYLLLAGCSALAPPATTSRFSRTLPTVHESFGFSFGGAVLEQSDSVPRELLGEANYKEGFVKGISKDALLLDGEPYNVVGRVKDLGLLKKTAQSGLLAKLDDAGYTLADLEGLLPVLEKAGALSFLADNLAFVNQNLLPLVVEPAPLLLPAVSATLGLPSFVFLLAGLGALAAETNFILTQNSDSFFLLSGPISAVVGYGFGAVSIFLFLLTSGSLSVNTLVESPAVAAAKAKTKTASTQVVDPKLANAQFGAGSYAGISYGIQDSFNIGEIKSVAPGVIDLRDVLGDKSGLTPEQKKAQARKAYNAKYGKSRGF